MILIRIFIGGRNGHAKSSFHAALGRIRAKFGDKIRVEILDTDTMKSDERFPFTPKQFIDCGYNTIT